MLQQIIHQKRLKLGFSNFVFFSDFSSTMLLTVVDLFYIFRVVKRSTIVAGTICVGILLEALIVEVFSTMDVPWLGCWVPVKVVQIIKPLVCILLSYFFFYLFFF